MIKPILATSLFAALMLSAPGARAADLDGEPPYRGYSGHAPRYEPPYGHRRADSNDVDGDRDDVEELEDWLKQHGRGPRRDDRAYKSYNDDEDGGSRHARSRCPSKGDIRNRLYADGWRDLRNPERHGGVVGVTARNENSGQNYALRLDTCTGDVLSARIIHPGHRDSRPYAYVPNGGRD